MITDIFSLGLDKPHVGKIFEFREIYKAIDHLKSGTSVGKVVVNIN